MSEADYWPELERRICDELGGLDDRSLSFHWCHGLIPTAYVLDGPRPHILGRAWIGISGDTHQELWDFELLLAHAVPSPDQIDWAALLPAGDVTRWLAVDPAGKRIQIEPGAAMPAKPTPAPDGRSTW